MNKIAKAIVILVAGTVLMAGTAVAAPNRGWGRRPHRPPPRQHVVHHVHHCDNGNTGWAALGVAAVIGGIIGAILD